MRVFRPRIERQLPAATLEAFSRSQAIIEFTPDGQVLTANALFLELLGYSLSEIVGRPHSIFVDDAEAATTAYGDFWPALARGEFQAREFRRITKAGEAVYIQASYNPVIVDGKVVRVVKIASDVTATKMAAADAQGQMAAVHRAQAVIEFDLNGKVTAVNDNFCKALGYTPAEIVGKHHRMFVEPQFAASADYASFWDNLREGQFHADEFLRIGKGGKRVWIQASYNPVYDPEGRLWKVVKFATDTTARKQAVEIIGTALGELAAGRLDCRIEQRLPDELEIVADALNETVDRLTQMVSGIRISAQALRAATGEILAGSNDLADRTSRQAAAVEETSAAVEQLTQTVTQNADRAAVTKSEALSVSVVASECGMVMGEADAAMHRISDSSAKIASIVEMIDDIAFQTNLLALNASVEAARAGDAGKGFAVVAVEVRRLAQSSAVASHDIKALVDASSVEVASGTRLVGEASSRVRRVLEGINKSTALVEEIARACQDQASAISEVSISVRQMDEMTQHNAALVEQTNAAIEQTEGQANALEGYVEQFSLSGKTSLSRSERMVALRA